MPLPPAHGRHGELKGRRLAQGWRAPPGPQAPAAHRGRPPLMRFDELVDPPFRLALAVTVFLLQHTDQLVALALDLV
jgi:hypothetical protein